VYDRHIFESVILYVFVNAQQTLIVETT